jgi:hypothetical protein
MQKYGIALLVGGLFMGVAAAATAQGLASAVPPPKGDFFVFAEKGNHALSPTAIAIIRTAAGQASSARHVTLSGRTADIALVKSELVRQGVPAEAIVVQREASASLPKVDDGLSDPMDRRVEIRF